MNIKNIFNNLPKNANEYIEFYFRKMVGISSSKNVFFNQYDDYYMSIMKDETRRVLEGTGKLRERPWSNFLFYFLSKSQYLEIFGSNNKKRNISEDIIRNDEFTLTEWDTDYSGKDPEEMYSNRKNNYKLAKYLFEEVKKNKPYLCIRAYVYLTIVIYDDSQIETRNYLTYYFNTSYQFSSTNGKKGFISNVRYSYLVEDIDFELGLIQDNNRDIIDCVRAFSGDLDFIEQTKFNYDNIVEGLDNGDKYILIEGAARTGKTIIAMCLLNKYPESQLLVMNYYFYNYLMNAFETMERTFPENRIFHQSYGKKGYYDGGISMKYSFLIIDECQRLGNKFSIIQRVIEDPNHKHAILLGDDYQRLKSDSDDGMKYIIEKITDTDSVLKKYKFNNAIGVPPEIVKNVKYLLGAPEMRNPYPLGEYSINIYESKNDFINAYETCTATKKWDTFPLPF